MLRYQDYRQHVEQLAQAALSAANPAQAVRRFMHKDGRVLVVGDLVHDLDQGRVYVVSVGKAAPAMAEAAIQILGDDLHAAIVVGKKGSDQESGVRGQPSAASLKVLEGNHPVSGEDSIQATTAVIQMLAQSGVEDLVIFLISGGTSALLTLPVIPLSDWQQLTNALLASGCTIDELNRVRRRLDRRKGGGLVNMAAPADCISLILSDVIGSPLEAIGSGPTTFLEEVPDAAAGVLDRYEIETRLEPDVWEHIQQILQQPPAPGRKGHLGRPVDQRNEHIIVGDVHQAATAALTRAMQMGFVTQLLTARLEGEAREVGRVAAAVAKDMPAGRCLILGGETTVTVKGDGLGGRNQELALAAAVALDGWPATVIASFATDGEDGPTAAAGAVVTGDTVKSGRNFGLDPVAYLDGNDSFHFFQRLDEGLSEVRGQQALLITGPTGTNLNDLLFLLTYPCEDG
jgi:hydroxypyruvate reductase